MENLINIFIENDSILLEFPDGKKLNFKINTFPDEFIKWQSTARMKMFEILKQNDSSSVISQPAHLPVLATSGEGPFSINLATRGLGILPKKEMLIYFTKLFNETLDFCKGKDWDDTLSRRVDTAISFYKDYKNFDLHILGGLEIFEGQTSKNLLKYPLASLLYTGGPPQFLSFQFNGIVKFINDDSPYYTFLLAARELFAFDRFHVHQIHYPYGYIFYLIDYRDKRPYPRGKSINV
jgi:hypothetical protein